MPEYKVFIDTCVLFTTELRSLLLALAEMDKIKVYWSENILQEWRRNSQYDIEAIIFKIQKDFPTAIIENYKDLENQINLQDKADIHVVAAAAKAQCDFILTFNTKDFPYMKLHPFGLDKIHPDLFLLKLLKKEPALIDYTNHNFSLKALEKCWLPKSCQFIQKHIED